MQNNIITFYFHYALSLSFNNQFFILSNFLVFFPTNLIIPYNHLLFIIINHYKVKILLFLIIIFHNFLLNFQL